VYIFSLLPVQPVGWGNSV